MNSYRFVLGETLSELGITRNKLAVESKVRPATILDIVNGEIKRIELETLAKIIDTLNELARESGSKRLFTINDVIKYPHE